MRLSKKVGVLYYPPTPYIPNYSLSEPFVTSVTSTQISLILHFPFITYDSSLYDISTIQRNHPIFLCKANYI